jgi:hypothetical protein
MAQPLDGRYYIVHIEFVRSDGSIVRENETIWAGDAWEAIELAIDEYDSVPDVAYTNVHAKLVLDKFATGGGYNQQEQLKATGGWPYQVKDGEPERMTAQTIIDVKRLADPKDGKCAYCLIKTAVHYVYVNKNGVDNGHWWTYYNLCDDCTDILGHIPKIEDLQYASGFAPKVTSGGCHHVRDDADNIDEDGGTHV